MIIDSFKTLLGSGRAWRLTGRNIKIFVQSIVTPMEQIRKAGYRIVYAPFLTQNIYADAENQLIDLENYEELFGVENSNNKTLKERQEQCEAQWSLVGGQGWQYIENVLKNAGLNCHVRENIPAVDVAKNGMLAYSSTVNEALIQYGSTVNEEPLQYGGWSYRLIGNGDLNISDMTKDPVSVEDYSECFFIEFEKPLTSGQYDNFVKLLLQIKPAQLGVLVKAVIY